MPRTTPPSIPALWLRYALQFAAVAAVATGACVMTSRRPAPAWGLLLLLCVVAGWMVTSVTSHHVTSAILARRSSAMSPIMQVLCTVCWSVANLLLVSVIVVGIALATGAVRPEKPGTPAAPTHQGP